MIYIEHTPRLNPYLSILTKDSDCLVLLVNGKIRKLKCNKALFYEIVSCVDGRTSFQKILEFFENRYPVNALKHFFDVLVRAEILLCVNGTGIDSRNLHSKDFDNNAAVNMLKANPPVFIADGILGEALRTTVEEVTSVGLFRNIAPLEQKMETSFNYPDMVAIFMERLQETQSSMVVVCPEQASFKWLLALNEACLLLHIPFLLSYFNGKHILLGPTVLPWKSPCYACLVQHRSRYIQGNSSLKLTLPDLFEMNEAWPVPEGSFNPKSLQWVASLILTEIIKILGETVCPVYVKRQVRIPLSGICEITETAPEITEIAFETLTTCPACLGLNRNKLTLGRPTNVIPPDHVKIHLKDSEARHADGGLRNCSAKEARKIIDGVLNKVGLAARIKKLDSGPLDKILPTFSTEIDNFYKKDFPLLITKRNHWGKGLSEEQAFLSGFFELVERICADYYGNVEMIRAPYKQVQDIAINVSARIGKVYFDYGIDLFDENILIDWIWGYSLTREKAVLVPAAMVYLTRSLFEGNFYIHTSGGLAAGTSIEDAILQGLNETIEHDSWMIYQANAITPPTVQIESIRDPKLLKIIEDMGEMGHRVVINYLKNDLGISVFRTWLINERDFVNFGSCGYGANLDPVIAINRSVTEAKLAIPSYQNKENLCFRSPRNSDLVSRRASLFNLYHFIKTDLGKGGQVDFSEIPNHSSGRVAKDIRKTVELLQNTVENSDVVVINLSKDIFNIPVVRVLSIGLQNCFKPIQCAQDRLFQMPKKLGLIKHELTYKEIYNGNYLH